MKYLDPSAIARLSNLSIAARTVVEGFISGLHHSPAKGISLEFAQHRQYVPGDELRHIDWKVYGRLDRYVVRQYEEETNMRCLLVLDTSASMGFKHTGTMSKLAYASYCAASLAYLMLKQQDSVGLAAADTALRHMIPPRSSTAHLANILEILESLTPRASLSIAPVLTDIGKRLQKRHLIIIFSDLFDNPESIIRAMRYFHFRKHEVIVFQILDPAERLLPFDGPVRFEAMEDNESLMTDAGPIKEDYQQLMNQYIERFRIEFRNAGIDYHCLDTAQPFAMALGSYLTKRQMFT